jgi:hypothetical protein
VNHLPKGRILTQILLLGILLPWTVSGVAGEPMTALAPAHGPVVMLYVSQPLGRHGIGRVYGLRLSQIAQQPTISTTLSTGLHASSPSRPLVDLQIRREADVRVEFGQRVTWDIRRREFDLSGAAFANSLASAPVWRSRP